MDSQNIKVEFHPVDSERWKDFEAFFESKGSPHYCWCCLWRSYKKNPDQPEKVNKKVSMQQRILNGIPVGILAYMDKQPVAWCSVAPRETFRNLQGMETDKKVWSIVCFFIKRPFRHLGLSRMLLKEAVRYAQNNGAEIVEAYPVERDSSSYRFMGFRDIFEEAGFTFIKKAGSRRYVMQQRIK